MRKIYIVGGGVGYANWMEGTIVDKMEDADLVVFTGGEDVHPDFYGHPRHPRTGANYPRDRYEMQQFDVATKLGKHIIGICRGSQLLCVANGGWLVQDQPNPKFVHPITTYDGKELLITSTHHQAAYPYNLPAENYQILGWTDGMLDHHENGMQGEMNPEKECEIVYYPKGKCLGIQGHPEMMEQTHPTIAYLRNLLNMFLLNTINNVSSNGETEDTKEQRTEEVQTANSLASCDA